MFRQRSRFPLLATPADTYLRTQLRAIKTHDQIMRDEYHQLLDAAIRHLEDLKAQGRRFIPVCSSTLEELKRPPRNGGAAKSVRPASTPPAQSPPKPAPSKIRAALPPEERGLALSAPGESGPARPSPVLTPEARAAAFAELQQRVLACTKCAHLASSRKNVVFGVGNMNADLMFVGEAPGADEDEQGEPFVGKAGQLLTRIIQTMGLSRETVYIANILKCRPDTPGQSAGNRKPTLEEMQTCIPYLHEQIDLIGPKVIVALGATAVEGLLGKTVGITRLRGQWRTYRGIPLMPTYHPAYLLRNQALSEKRRVWEDMLLVMEKLGLPINERQRNYFLKTGA
ncbi:MAG TPA: uracil-DNA glycosylase family protein [Candidatus Limnocylindrales bacterium]|nr:uracil-DNA glycosylase family protein [Candidatus Limnocylindrales bacterium]